LKPASRRWLTGAEALAVSLLTTLSSVVVAVYLFDRVGLAFTPHRMLAIAAAAAIAAIVWLYPYAAWRTGDAAAFVAVVAATFGGVMWLARPDFLPLGSGPDLTHHLLLIGFIERHWTLVHDASVEWAIGEMVQYTPGSHALAALAGAWSGTDGLHALHPLLAATFALKVGFVFLVTLRLLPAGAVRIPLALAGTVLLGLPLAYVLGSFAHYSFVAQAVAELFAVGMWWTLTVWDESPDWRSMAIFALAGSAAFLTWPVWVGAPIAALFVLVFLHDRLSTRERAMDLLIACVPIGGVAVLYTIGRLGYAVIIRTGGDVLAPSLRVYGVVFLALTAAGVLAGAFERRARATIVFTGALALEAVALFTLARTRGTETPYMALKMFYLLVYPQAALAALALAAAFGGVTRHMMQSRPARGAREETSRWAALAPLAGWMLVAALAAGVAPVARASAATLDSAPAVSQPLFLAGTWAREHVPPSCVEYLVGDGYSSYWLHLAVLGNQWMAPRTGDAATFNQRDAIIRWLTPGGLRYAVVDLATLPADVRRDLDIIATFGSAAVAQRRGPSSCPGT
jgi:hypothetical protein